VAKLATFVATVLHRGCRSATSAISQVTYPLPALLLTSSGSFWLEEVSLARTGLLWSSLASQRRLASRRRSLEVNRGLAREVRVTEGAWGVPPPLEGVNGRGTARLPTARGAWTQVPRPRCVMTAVCSLNFTLPLCLVLVCLILLILVFLVMALFN